MAVEGEITVGEALRLINEEKTRALVIVENGKFTGMVSDNEILKFVVDNSNCGIFRGAINITTTNNYRKVIKLSSQL